MSAIALPASTRCNFLFVIVTLTGFFSLFALAHRHTYSFLPASNCRLQTIYEWTTWVSFFFSLFLLLPLWWSRIIKTRVSEGFMKFRCFYHTLTEHYLLSLSLPPSVQSKAINTFLTVSPHTDKSCKFLVLYFLSDDTLELPPEQALTGGCLWRQNHGCIFRNILTCLFVLRHVLFLDANGLLPLGYPVIHAPLY